MTFKNYNVGQISLLPPSLEEPIPEEYLVWLVNQTVDQIEIKTLKAK